MADTNAFLFRWKLMASIVLTVLCPILGSNIVEANSATIRANETPPNIVFLFADDLGWTDLACYGSGYYETPNIDRIRQQGMKFTSAYTNGPNCAPTRACLMSGKYSPRHGVYTVGSRQRGEEKFRKMIAVTNRTHLPLDEITIAEALRDRGYATVVVPRL